jgi:hypothetical protein
MPQSTSAPGFAVECIRKLLRVVNEKLLSTRRSTLVLGGECNRTSVSILLAQLVLC